MSHSTDDKKIPASKFLPFFTKADVLTKELNDTSSAKAKSIKVGHFLGPNVDRTVPIEVNGRSGRATLRAVDGRSNTRLYFFEIVWDSIAETIAAEAEEKKAEKRRLPTVNKPLATRTAVKDTPKTAASSKQTAEKQPARSKQTAKKQPGTGNQETWD